jgi:hypothetical protein
MVTNIPKSVITSANTAKTSNTIYGVATYGEYFYTLGKVPDNIAKSAVTISNVAKS